MAEVPKVDTPPPEKKAKPQGRIACVDAYRGFVMILMLAEVLKLPQVAKNFPDSPLWHWLSTHQSHVTWRGCTLHDLIQPSFSFLVGTALAFSLANRTARGLSEGMILLHAAYRAVTLILLGVFLRSVSAKQTYWTFEDTLTQIGLGYFFLVVIALLPKRWAYLSAAILLLGVSIAYGMYPAPTPEFFVQNNVGVAVDWPHHTQDFAAHWDKNSNAGWAFDRWFLNQFPREKPFEFHPGGYTTLSFIPTLVTMLFGLIAGRGLLAKSHLDLLGAFILGGAALLAAGFALDHFDIVPNVKRIWTPSWTLFSGGWCFLILACFLVTTDMLGYSGWAYPLKVVGANSIFAYVGSHLGESFLFAAAKRHLGPKIFTIVGETYEPLVAGGTVLIIYWLILWWMYRRGIFIKI